MTFPEFLTEEGFQADACQSCIHPDFYRLARSLYHRTRILERELGHANAELLEGQCNTGQILDYVLD